MALVLALFLTPAFPGIPAEMLEQNEWERALPQSQISKLRVASFPPVGTATNPFPVVSSEREKIEIKMDLSSRMHTNGWSFFHALRSSASRCKAIPLMANNLEMDPG